MNGENIILRLERKKMQNSIIIIESPNKCEKIAHYSGAKVYATKGHFKELAQDYVNWDNYNPKFVTKESSKKHINFLFSQCKGRDVYIATDPDREGYAIGYMVFEVIKNIAKSIKRAEFHEITKEGIEKGLREAKDFNVTNKNMYEAFKARCVGDKMVGFILSPKLATKFGTYKNISVGRVQTPALSLIAQRESEIAEFEKTPKEQRLSYKVTAKAIIENKDFILTNDTIFVKREEAQSFIDSLNNIKEAFISTINTKETKKSPPKPFQAVSLIKQANITYNFSSEETMNLAQKLFEKGLITYHRTDSESISESFLNELEKQYSKEAWYQKRFYKAGKHSQAEAHEAIRITSTTKADVENLSENEIKLYSLIFNNTIYSQSKESVYTHTHYECSLLGRIFSFAIKIPIYQGIFDTKNTNEEYDVSDRQAHDTEGNVLSNTQSNEQDNTSIIQEKITEDSIFLTTSLHLKENDKIIIQELQIKEIEKRPPTRYKESDFIPLLQKLGIGRPSTYHTFIPTLLKREYVEIKKTNAKKSKDEIFATNKGMQAIAYLESMQDTWITTHEFTKAMEEILDLIAESKATYLDFIKPLHEKMGSVIPTQLEKKLPSQAQINFAMKLAKQHNIELPQEIQESMKACCDFIEKYNIPTQKALDFAKKLAQNHNITMPKDIEKSAKVCSEFIAKYKDKKEKA